MVKKIGNNNIAERLRIQEKALSNLADTLRENDTELNEEIRDIVADLKSIKLFLSRNMPVFKDQFPGIRKKIK
jgi:hypothetical protein